MSGDSKSPLKRFGSYVGYGVAACILLAIPLIAIDWLFKNLPFVDVVFGSLQTMDQPIVAVVIGLCVSVAVLALLGWVLRRFLWDALSRAPVIGTLMTTSQQFAEAMASIDRERRDLVVWLQLLRYRTLCIIVSKTRDDDGTEFATLYVLNGAGQFQGNQICSAKVEDLIFPGWTVDEAVVFSSAGGAVVPELAAPPTRAEG